MKADGDGEGEKNWRRNSIVLGMQLATQ